MNLSNRKKAEFFMISIIIILVSLITLLGVPKSAIQSTHFSETNFNSELMQIIEAKNSGKFWNYSWESQTKILTASNETGRLKIENFEISSGINCESDIVILNSNKVEIESDTESSGTNTCDIAFNFESNQNYFIMHNALFPYSASYSRSMPAGTFNKTYSIINEKNQDICTYSKQSISSKAHFSCTYLESNKIKIEFTSPELIYSAEI